jgi:hypothetical protein
VVPQSKLRHVHVCASVRKCGLSDLSLLDDHTYDRGKPRVMI